MPLQFIQYFHSCSVKAADHTSVTPPALALAIRQQRAASGSTHVLLLYILDKPTPGTYLLPTVLITYYSITFVLLN